MLLSTPAYWSVRLKSGEELSEYVGREWSRDLVLPQRVRDIDVLRLHCPDGHICTLDSVQPGTAFQLKQATMTTGVGRTVLGYIIGRIDDRVSGACTCHVWDPLYGLFENYTTCFKDFRAWRPGIDDLGALSLAAQGMDDRI